LNRHTTGNDSLDSPINDLHVIEQCRHSDAAGFEKLIIKYQDRLYNLLLRISGNEDDAAELTQDTFIKAMQAIDSFQGKSNFYTWLCRIGMNLAADLARKRRRSVSGDELYNYMRLGPAYIRDYIYGSPDHDPVKLMQDKETAQIVSSALAMLDDQLRFVLVLRDIDGMSYQQIAAVLKIEHGTVKSRISRARKNLRQILETLCNEE